MNQIIQFFIRTRDFFVFLGLFIVAIGLVFRSNYYPQSVYINSANDVTGKLYAFGNYWSGYFHLRSENEHLAEENRQLHKQVLLLEQALKQVPLADSLAFVKADSVKYKVFKANVIKNSYRLNKNYLTIDKGTADGVKQDMGVVSPRGIVGIVENTSGRFATVQSVLNTQSALNVMVKRTGHFGSLRWDTKQVNVVQLLEVPNIVPIQNGDTIVTGGMSNIFPKGLPVGKIVHFEKSKLDNTFLIDVLLFADMASLDYVYIIEDTDRKAINELEKQNPK
ncbi:rod shape-determining protein MreC [Capnocytophaga sp. oral taxon 878]|uniref:rod shape-determining protein MreC n=1 Tax=Capnocytophaga sp. oral taxon 878 TaxID=1316596 RepID=UPI000D0366D2|nr:rod shape-determining protein MreC [Capnocytophaga sp. oral taxon 878]AVM50560.1 rod shape-determining protein MreC [Capnocytophaga sp. oral taxon 878]